jgi:hypothetical protein
MMGKTELLSKVGAIESRMSHSLCAGLLEALGEATAAIGGGLIETVFVEDLPDEINGYLAFSLMLVRAEALHDGRSALIVCRAERDELGDGYGAALLAEVLAALADDGVRLVEGSDGWDYRAIDAHWAIWRSVAAGLEVGS